MAERQPERKREKQSISVPFIWEEKPGMPKQDWKPTARPIKHHADPPIKLIVSVPFVWEEKPGTPLRLPTQSTSAASIQNSIIIPSPPKYSDHGYGNWTANDCTNDDDQGENEGDGSISDLELDTCSFGTDDSFTSAKSLLANGLISTTAISSAVPVQQMQSNGSPTSETDSTTSSSYATGTTSLAGAPFLEWLFPLLMPNSNTVGCLEKDPSQKANVQQQGKEFLHEISNTSQVRRPLLTLGELIVMSRRRSCQRKVTKIHQQQSMDFMKRNAYGCCIFGTGNILHAKWKRQLQLKLM